MHQRIRVTKECTLIYLQRDVYFGSTYNCTTETDGWITQFYVLFNSVSIISGRWTCDNEKLYAIEFNMNGYTFRESNFYIISFPPFSMGMFPLYSMSFPLYFFVVSLTVSFFL